MKKYIQDNLVKRHIRSLDSNANKILFYTKTSSVYKHKCNAWEETGIEGTCIIYNQFFTNLKVICVLNRKKKDDFFLCIERNMKITREGNIVIIINTRTSEVYGMWFCESETIDEVIRILNN
ncbi:mRNA-decapping enzyme 1B [Nosema granulosis]|uniref:mRNA-decapping enzyme 1B n=1 Tax=Nosema granulosis TaxID=83296 RepID=A0A9P6H2F9_9MICR|nr:mRNA-decapping enzyme 1B [Nosema granulosis]